MDKEQDRELSVTLNLGMMVFGFAGTLVAEFPWFIVAFAIFSIGYWRFWRLYGEITSENRQLQHQLALREVGIQEEFPPDRRTLPADFML